MSVVIKAEKNDKGFIALNLTLMSEKGDVICDNVSIKVNDYAGSQKKRARALTYKIFKALGGK